MNLADLAQLYHLDGPALTVYFDTRHDTEDAAKKLDIRWRDLARDLTNRGVDDKVIELVGDAIRDDRADLGAHCVVATSSGVCLSEHWPEPPRRDLGWWDALPYLAPLVEYRQQAQPHLVVLADRTGADIVAFSGTGEQAIDEVGGMPEEFPVHKAKAGGWSQKRYQQRVENTWDKNAAEAAEHVTKIAERIGARMIAGAGDARALQLLQEHLPPEVGERFRTMDGNDASIERVGDEVTRLVADEAARDTVAALEQFRNAKAGDLACEGVADTLRALAEARVETLLVHDDPDDARRALFGQRSEVVGTEKATLQAMGATEVAEGRLADVAIRAALGTDAAVRIIPGHGGPAEGIGAVLRWSNG